VTRLPYALAALTLLFLIAGSALLARPEGERVLASVNVASFERVTDTQEVVVLDVRTPEEYAAGRLPGARNIDFYAPDFAEQIAALDRDTPYAIYCRSGNRSGTTLTLMRTLGFTQVHDLSGGMSAWLAQGGEVCTRC
jgi:rhodanese-related sulfurtransferase